jgi:hypothetical protein
MARQASHGPGSDLTDQFSPAAAHTSECLLAEEEAERERLPEAIRPH